MLIFSDTRVAFARDQIQSQFSLTKQVDVTLDTYPAGAGKIKISTVTPETLPWSGVYFDGVPVTITATANPGYEFRYWEANNNLPGNDSLASITLNVDSSDTFRAHFEKLELGVDVYPNPFADLITINYQLPESMQVSIKLYSIIGQEVAEIVSPETFQSEGSKSVQFSTEGRSLAQGLYFLEFKAKDLTTVVKLVKARGK
jgi:hypothetical protein